MSTTIRKMNDRDIDTVKELLDAEVGYRLKITTDELKRYKDTYWVAVFHHEIIGVIGIEPQYNDVCGYKKEDYDCIKVIAIKVGYWNIGVGHRLLQHALASFKTKKKGILAEAWDLEVGGVPRVGRVLTDLGFKIVTKVKKNYTEVPESRCNRYNDSHSHCDRCSLSLYIR